MLRKLAAVIVILFIGSATWVQAETPVKVGLSLGLTGRYQEMGQMQQMEFRLWGAQVNQRGGLLGRPLQLIIYDDHSDRDTAVRLYSKLINEDHVDFVFGPYSSGLTEAIPAYYCQTGLSGSGFRSIFGQALGARLHPSVRHLYHSQSLYRGVSGNGGHERLDEGSHRQRR